MRSRHPYVYLFTRARKDGATTYHARVCPPGDRAESISLTKHHGVRSQAEAERWACDRSERLVEVVARRSGVRPWPVADAVDLYLEDCRTRLQETTVADYERAMRGFAEWTGERVRYAEEVTPDLLFRYRTAVLARGTSASHRNSLLRRVAAGVQWIRRSGMLPLVTRDDIGDRLTKVREPRPVPEVLGRERVADLLAAAERHDREEAPRRRRASTAMVRVAVALVRLHLLAGLRPGEVWGLDWREVRLRERQLNLAPRKTGVGRVVDLDVSPSVVELLEQLGPREEGPVLPGVAAAAQSSQASGALRGVRQRLSAVYGARPFLWKSLRSTCASYLLALPHVPVYAAARRMGHGVEVMQRHYADLVKPVPGATTLEEALGLEERDATGVARESFGSG